MKLITKIVGATLGLAMAIGVGLGIANNNRAATGLNANPGDEVNAIANIVSGKSYYIKGVRTNGTIEYLTFTDATGSQSGTSSSTTSGATILTFTAVDGGYNITTPSGKYIAPGTSNGKIAVSADPVTVSATNQSSKIRLSIVSGTDTWSIQKNKTGANFGGYKNTQNDITLIEASAATVTAVSVSGSMSTTSYTTVQSWSNAGLTATATMSDSSSYGGVFTWSYSPTSPAAAVAANSGNAIASLAVTATASAQGKSGSKETSGISVSLATVAQVAAATPASGTLEGVIAKGIVSQVDSFNGTYHSITYWISDDGTTTNQYEVYGGKNVGNTDFANIDAVQVGDIVVVYGDITTFNAVKEFKQNNYLLSLARPEVSSVAASIKDGTYYAGTTLSASDFNVTVSWTAGKANTNPVDGFTWTVNDEPFGALEEGDNSVVVTYNAVDSAAFNVVGAPASAKDVVRTTLSTKASLAYHYNATEKIVTDTLDKALADISGSGYQDWSDKQDQSSAVYAGNSLGSASLLQLKSKDSVSGVVTTTSGGLAKKVTITWNASTTDGQKADIYGKQAAYTSPANLYNNSTQGTKIGTIEKGESTELTITGNYAFIGIRSYSGALYIDSIEIDWLDGYNYAYSDVSTRFSSLISVSLWNRLNTESSIQGYGVMLSTPEFLTTDTIEDIYDGLYEGDVDDTIDYMCDGSNIKNFYMPLTTKSPDLANSAQKAGAEGDHYIWYLNKTVLDTEEGLTAQQVKAKLTQRYTAVGYIRIANELVFLDQITASAAGLADAAITGGQATASTANGSLKNLADMLA